MPEPTLEHIISGCKQGHAPCQKALVQRYSGFLFSICLRYIGDETKSKDVLQDAFIRIFKYIRSFDADKGSLKTWMSKIVVNTALKQINKKGLENSTLTIDFNDKVSVEPSILDKMATDDLLELVRSLPEGYRQVFNLSVIEGYSHKEIAKMLKIKEVSSRSNLSRAKQILRIKLMAFKNSESWARRI